MLKTLLLLLFTLIISTFSAFSQGKYLVYFTDKANNGYSVDKPLEFLSQKSIERRQRQGIPVRYSDLPVTKAYSDSLKKLGFHVWYTSRWFNAAYVYVRDTSKIRTVASKLGFVSKIDVLKPTSDTIFAKNSSGRKQKTEKNNIESNDYGNSLNQVSQIGADEMHKMGYNGKGITIAIFDGGFTNADKVSFLDSVFQQNRVLGTYDFVYNKPYVYFGSDHGTNVMSCIAGYSKGKLIGTGYKASFYLFRTEDGASEYPVEEANWLIAAEKADSLGVDIINSSLGYSSFDDPRLDNTFEKRDGRKPISSRAAAMAARVGMISIISAGNGGRSKIDPYVSSPGDADSVLTVGAVDSDGKIAEFSSFGPTVDGRIKPDVVAKGVSATLGYSNGSISTGNGTSFSAPVLTGMVAGLWQSLPSYTNMQIINLVRRSGSLSSNPENKMGYGIPNFFKAQLLSMGKSHLVISDKYIYPNPFTNEQLMLVLNPDDVGKTFEIEIYDISAKSIFKQKIENAQMSNMLNLNSQSLIQGLYFVKLAGPSEPSVIKLMKN